MQITLILKPWSVMVELIQKSPWKLCTMNTSTIFFLLRELYILNINYNNLSKRWMVYSQIETLFEPHSVYV